MLVSFVCILFVLHRCLRTVFCHSITYVRTHERTPAGWLHAMPGCIRSRRMDERTVNKRFSDAKMVISVPYVELMSAAGDAVLCEQTVA